MSQRNYDGSWARQYRFTLQPHQYTDYEAMCWYHQSSPQSHFTQKRVCTRLSDDGRITLSDLRLITTNKTGIKETRLLADEHEFTEVLRTHFGIHASGRESMSVQCT